MISIILAPPSSTVCGTQNESMKSFTAVAAEHGLQSRSLPATSIANFKAEVGQSRCPCQGLLPRGKCYIVKWPIVARVTSTQRIAKYEHPFSALKSRAVKTSSFLSQNLLQDFNSQACDPRLGCGVGVRGLGGGLSLTEFEASLGCTDNLQAT